MADHELSDEVIGRTLYTADGSRLGKLVCLYDDTDTGDIAFGAVAMIRRGRRRNVFVPLTGAKIEPSAVTVRCGEVLARRAPNVREGQTLPADQEAALFAHYDLPYRRARHGQRRLAAHAPTAMRG